MQQTVAFACDSANRGALQRTSDKMQSSPSGETFLTVFLLRALAPTSVRREERILGMQKKSKVIGQKQFPHNKVFPLP